MKKETGLTKTIIAVTVIIISIVFTLIGILYINNNSLQSDTRAITNPQDLNPLAKNGQIILTGKGFFPQTLIISKGQEVTWINNDTVNHEIMFSSRSLLGLTTFSSSTIAPNESFSFTFEQEETVYYREAGSSKELTGQIVIK